MFIQKQIGWLFITLIVLLNLVIGIILYPNIASGETDTNAVLSILITELVIVLLFYQMTIKVDGKKIQISYGVGIIKINKCIEQLDAIEVTKTPWYYGLGIRITPNGWLYNIQSLKAIKITHIEKGKPNSFFIGTPHPEDLKEQIEGQFRTIV